MNNTTNTFGIYLIQNIQVDSHFYVGSTSASFSKRWYQHRRDFRKGTNSPHLQRAWDKYGEAAFEFSILQEILPIQGESVQQRKARVLKAEQEWINILQPYYNICPTAGSRLGSKQTEETKELIKKRMSTLEAKVKMTEGQNRRWSAITEDERKVLYAARVGKSIHSDAHKAHLSEIANEQLNSPEAIAKRAATKKGQKRTEEQRQRMREAQARRAPMTDEQKTAWRSKISASLKASGHKPPSTKGKVMSQAQKQKISLSRRGL